MLKKIIFVLALVSAYLPSANAGFALVAPSVSYVSSGATALVQAAANDVSFAGGIRAAGGIVNVAGTAVTVPAAYRFAANAPRVAAAFAYANPAILLGVGAVAAYAYYNQSDFFIDGGIWKKATNVPAVVWSYTFTYNYASKTITDDTAAAVAAVYWPLGNSSDPTGQTITYQDTGCSLYFGSMRCTAVRQACDKYGCTTNNSAFYPQQVNGTKKQLDPVPEKTFEDDMAGKPLTPGVPQALPVPLPVDPVPILNPSPVPTPSNPLTDPVPTPQPLRVPQALPQPIPGTNPQQYRQPVIDIVPANDSSSPWKVDLQPKDLVSTDPNPLTDPVANPTPSTDPAPFDMPCGVAGKAPCGVKVDETGMPSNPTAEGYNAKLDSLKVDQDGLRNTVSTPADKPFFSGWSVLFSAPAAAACSPIVLPNGPSGVSMGSLNPCPVVDGVRYIMGLIWAATGMFFSLKMIREVI